MIKSGTTTITNDQVCAGQSYSLTFNMGSSSHWLLLSSVANSLPNANGW